MVTVRVRAMPTVYEVKAALVREDRLFAPDHGLLQFWRVQDSTAGLGAKLDDTARVTRGQTNKLLNGLHIRSYYPWNASTWARLAYECCEHIDGVQVSDRSV